MAAHLPPSARSRGTGAPALAVLVALLLVATTACSGGHAKPAAVVHGGPLRVCAAQDDPPMVYAGAGPVGLHVTGFEVELLAAVAQDLHRSLRLRLLSFPAVLAGVRSGSCLVGIGSITVTAARRRTMAFTVPYYEEDRSVVAHRSARLTRRSQLAGRQVGVLVGTPEATSAGHDLPAGVTIQRFATVAGLYSALDDGTVSAVYADLSLNASEQITHRDLATVLVHRTGVQDAIAVATSAPDLVVDLDRGLKDVQDDGTARDLYHRYFSLSPP